MALAVVVKWFDTIRRTGDNFLEQYWGLVVASSNYERSEQFYPKDKIFPFMDWVAGEKLDDNVR